MKPLSILLLALAVAQLSAADFNRRLITVECETGRLLELALPEDRNYGSPSWSHDGRWIAFDSWLTTETVWQSHVFVSRPGGGKLVDLGAGAMPHWSSDDKQLVCHTYGISRPNSLVVLSVDGSGREILNDNGGNPRWSPDGTNIAFIRGKTNIGLLDTISGVSRDALVGRWRPRTGIDWGPAGRAICFADGRNLSGEASQLIVMQRGPGGEMGVGRVRLTGWEIGSNLAWSHSRNLILVSLRKNPRTPFQLHTLDPEGSGPPVLLRGQTPRMEHTDPAWSPDGNACALRPLSADQPGD